MNNYAMNSGVVSGVGGTDRPAVGSAAMQTSTTAESSALPLSVPAVWQNHTNVPDTLKFTSTEESELPEDYFSDSTSVEICLSDEEQQPQLSSAANCSTNMAIPKDIGAPWPFDVVLVESESDTDVCVDCELDTDVCVDSESDTYVCVDSDSEQEPPKLMVYQADSGERKPAVLWPASEPAECSPLPVCHRPVADVQPAASLPSAVEEQFADPTYGACLQDNGSRDHRNLKNEVDFPNFHGLGGNEFTEEIQPGEARISEASPRTVIKREPDNFDYETYMKFIDPSTEFSESDVESYMYDQSTNSDFITKNKRERGKQDDCQTLVECSLCRKSFLNNGMLQQHFDCVHLKQKTCGNQFAYKPNLLFHNWKVHKKVSSDSILMPHSCSHHCPCCSKVFKYPALTNRHFFIVHLNDKPYTCFTCGDKFADLSLLLAHQMTHTSRNMSPEVPQNELCRQHYTAKTDASSSFTYQHSDSNDVSPASEEHQTSVATVQQGTSSSFAHLSLHQSHEHSHTSHSMEEQSPFWCGVCGEAFQTRKSLKMHLQAHSGSLVYPCVMCDKTFTILTNLQRHAVQAHRTERCTHTACAAEKEGSTETHIQKQMKDKQQILPLKLFPCLQCSSCFVSVANLEKHSLVHSMTLPYQCNVCGWRSSQPWYLKNHMQIHQPLPQPSEASADVSTLGGSQQYQLASAPNLSHDTKPHIDIIPLQLSDIKPMEPESDVDVCVDMDSDDEPLNQAVQQAGGEESIPRGLRQTADSGPFLMWHQPVADLRSRVDVPSAGEEQDRSVDISVHNQKSTNEGMESTTLHGLGINGVAEGTNPGNKPSGIKQEWQQSDPKSRMDDKYLPCQANKSYAANERKRRSNSKTRYERSVQFSCSQCPAHFQTNSELISHRSVQHPGIRDHACPQCGKSFINLANVARHVRFIHLRGKRFMCKTCRKRFVTKEKLYFHYRKGHLQRHVENESRPPRVIAGTAELSPSERN